MQNKAVLTVAIITCLLLFGLFMACGLEEAAKDAGKQDFDKEVELELDPITLDKGGKGVIENCGTTNVNAELDKVEELADLELDIESVELQWIKLKYRNASWTPTSITTIYCQLTVEGSQGTIVIDEFGVNGSGSDWNDVEVTEEIQNAINYYLAHRDEDFTYCASCDDDPETFHAEFLLNLGVEIKGEVTVD